MKDSERLEALIAAVNHLAVSIGAMQETLLQLIVEIREPSSSDLPELMRAMIAMMQNMNVAMVAQTKAIDGMGGTVTQMGARISELRDQIARATA